MEFVVGLVVGVVLGVYFKDTILVWVDNLLGKDK